MTKDQGHKHSSITILNCNKIAQQIDHQISYRMARFSCIHVPTIKSFLRRKSGNAKQDCKPPADNMAEAPPSDTSNPATSPTTVTTTGPLGNDEPPVSILRRESQPPAGWTVTVLRSAYTDSHVLSEQLENIFGADNYILKVRLPYAAQILAVKSNY